MRLLWQQLSSPTITEILCNSTLDGVVFDLEHGCFNNETLYTCIQVCLLKNKLCFIRVTWLDKTVIRMSLDAGVSGVIFSTVQNYFKAKEYYDYCFYPPKGSRGQGLVRENEWGNKDFKKRDPIVLASKNFSKFLSEQEFIELKKNAREEVEVAFEYAELQDWPLPEDTLNDVYVNYPIDLIKCEN